MSRADWACGRVEAVNAGVISLWVCLGILCSLGLCGVHLVNSGRLSHANLPSSLFVTVVVLWVLLVGWALAGAIIRSGRRLRFGRPHLALATLPGVIGQEFEATLHVRVPVPEATQFVLRMQAIRRVTKRDADGELGNPTDELLYEETACVDGRACTGVVEAVAVPVRFSLPSYLPATCAGTAPVRWELLASADLDGFDFHAVFELPVFCTDASPPAADPPAAGAARPLRLRRSRIGLDDQDGLVVTFPAFFNPNLALIGCLFSILFVGGTAMLIETSHPGWAVALGLPGIFILRATLNAVLVSTRLSIRDGEVVLARLLAGVLLRTRRWATSDLAGAVLTQDTRMGTTHYHRLTLCLAGSPPSVPTGPPAVTDAERRRATLRQRVSERRRHVVVGPQLGLASEAEFIRLAVDTMLKKDGVMPGQSP